MARTLKEIILDAVINGTINGQPYTGGIRLNAETLLTHFLSETHSVNYLKGFLANSEMNSGTRYKKFVVRNPKQEGDYFIHPNELLERMKERQLI